MSYLQNFKMDLSGNEAGKKLIFLHGLMGSGVNWRRITPAFRDKFHILTFDQRGHGRSFKPESGYAPEDYALDLKLIMDELGWSKASLVGHSMGGRNALFFAQKFPQRIEALVIEDIGPQGNPVAAKATLKMINMVPVPFRGGKEEAKRYFEGEFLDKMTGNPNKNVLSQFLYTNIELNPDGSADWRFAKEAILNSLSEGHAKKLWDAVRDLTLPTLFIRGENSRDFPREEYLEVLRVNPRIKGVEVAQSGHWVHFDQPDKFTEVLQNFLDQNLTF